MRCTIIRLFVLLLIGGIGTGLVTEEPAEAALVFHLGSPDIAGNWSGTTPEDGLVTVTFEDWATNTVRLTIDATNAYEYYDQPAKVTALYFNYDDSKDSSGSPGLAFAYVSGVPADATHTWPEGKSDEEYKPDGDGYFDVYFDYPQSAAEVLPNEDEYMSVYDITKTGLTAADFNFGSSITKGKTHVPNGDEDGYEAVVHVQQLPYAGSKDSAFFGPMTIPEPASVIIWSLLGVLGITFGWWRCRRGT